MFPYFPIVFPYFSIFLVIRMSFLGTPTNDPGTRLPSGTSSLPGTNGPTAVDNDEWRKLMLFFGSWIYPYRRNII
jgi:hypothetical protein